jgi:hypothetical protein
MVWAHAKINKCSYLDNISPSERRQLSITTKRSYAAGSCRSYPMPSRDRNAARDDIGNSPFTPVIRKRDGLFAREWQSLSFQDSLTSRRPSNWRGPA